MALSPTSSRGASGAAPTVKRVRFPFAFNTPGLVPTSFPIIAVDADNKTITVAGDRTAAFAVGVGFAIAGSSDYDQPGTVVSATVVGGNTVIDGNFFFIGPTADGAAVVAVGLPIYTPAPGETMFALGDNPVIHGSISEAWNGTTPILHLTNELGRRSQSLFNTPIDVTIADNDLFVTGEIFVNSPGFSASNSHRFLRFASASPILVWVASNDGLDPGSTQGAGELVFLILAAE
jgi:hypothetical protein